ncbi:hypothetical protein SAMN05421788_106116 [Filimonas lacunae]|uniref:DUF1579 domain-containing protein n=1 Tax=Filimonas lacunae TaxID=477680 RepID=A0A173MEW9_9BACT|nr:hypothetical protein [Filimonas lacunae]BAV06046.1 hypothetical protein FLA_2061 [Filimonas lacunae]SIT24386.1 hypothetical protein SAMN05421788_106116 [Filimonas lacunae]
MQQLSFNTTGQPVIAPSASSSATDFDFIAGKWQVHNKKLAARLSNNQQWLEFTAQQEAWKVLQGIGNIDSFTTTLDGKPFEGMTVRLFNPVTRLWSIYWADSNHGKLDAPVTGSFENQVGRFYGRDTWEGQKVLVQFCWDVTNPEHPTWSQAFSTDNGLTWEWNWYMFLHRE